MRRTSAGMLLAILCLALPARAEESKPARAEAPRPKDVYTVRPWLDGSIIVGTALASGIPYFLSDQIISVRCPCDLNSLPVMDRTVAGNHSGAARTLSDVTLGLAIAAPVVVSFFDVGWSRTLLDDTVIYAQTLTVNGAVTTLFKYTVQRPYPKLFQNPSPKEIAKGENYLAFYSGHVSVTTSMLTAMAMTLTLRHGFSPWPWLAMAVVGTAVAWERVDAGQHYYTDVIVGGFMGIAVGVLVPWLHVRRDWGSPTVTAEAGAVTLGWQRRW